MARVLKTIAGLALVALILQAASWAVRDCTAGLYTYDNCLWLSLRERLGLPENKLLRAATLEVVGLVLLAGLIVVCRFLYRTWRVPAPPSDAP